MDYLDREGLPLAPESLRRWSAAVGERQRAVEEWEHRLAEREQQLLREKRRVEEAEEREEREGRRRYQQMRSDPYFRRARRLMGAGLIPVYQIILGINIAVFLVDLLIGGMTGRGFLWMLGVKWGPAIWDGQYWRLITPVFLHGGLMHLLFNSWAIYLTGPIIEDRLGRWRFLALYLLAGLVGTTASLFFMPFTLSVGASGAIFGLFGYFLFARWQRPLAFPPHVSQWLTTIVVINLLITFVPGTRIDMWGHIGGLIGGFLAGWVVGLPGQAAWPGRRDAAGGAFRAVAVLALIFAFVLISVNPGLRVLLR